MENEDAKELAKSVQALSERVSFLERVVGTMAQQRGVPASNKQVVSPGAVAKQEVAAAPVKPKTSAEIEVGQKWLSVVGIIFVFLSALFFVQFVFQFVGPAGKLLLSYVGAGVLFGIAIFTKKKYPPFSGVVGAGAWGVTYLATYAMHFFPATRIVTSTPLALFLLTVVVVALLGLALYQKSRVLVSVGFILGFLTMILSPLSLFSIVGAVLLLGVLVAIAVKMPWGDFILPATIGGYATYFFWASNIFGHLPAPGDGVLEREVIGLIALVAMWLIVAAGLVLRRDKEEAVGAHADSLSLLLATVGTAFFGFLVLNDSALVGTMPRLANAVWFLLVAGLVGGWSFIAQRYKEKKDVIVTGVILSILLLMSSIVYFLPEKSSGTAVAWAVLGLSLVVAGIFVKNSRLAAVATLPLVGTAIRFILIDMEKDVALLGGSYLTLNLLFGLVITLIIVGSAALMRMLDLAALGDKQAKRLPGALLVVGLIVFCAITAQEFLGAVPSILWGLAGLVTIVAGFFAHWKDARLVGLMTLAATVARVLMYDLSDLDPLPRVVSFGILGSLLLLIGYGYNHNREKLQRYLEED